ncbi:hypothetical protein ABIC83_002871 [Roseateles asaccharophilus]|uniref:hypothetical protein n=1 Tax=Roseateles asaccharophilus TaxID=582607 RepID=UPI003832E743
MPPSPCQPAIPVSPTAFAMGDKVRFTAEYLEGNIDYRRALAGRVGEVTGFRAGAPTVEFPKVGRRKPFTFYEVPFERLERAP